MNCKKAMEMIMTDSIDSSLASHVDSCRDCRDSARIWHELENMAPDEHKHPIPEILDFKIRGEAASRINKSRHDRAATRRIIFFYATAACLILTLWGVVILGKSTLDSKRAGSATSRNSIEWNNVDMEMDFISLNSELEGNSTFFNASPSDGEIENTNDYDLEIPELLT